MNIMRTAMLLAFMTALFMGVGYFVGGGSGMVIALIMASGLNFFLIGIQIKSFYACMARVKWISIRRLFIIRL